MTIGYGSLKGQIVSLPVLKTVRFEAVFRPPGQQIEMPGHWPLTVSMKVQMRT